MRIDERAVVGHIDIVSVERQEDGSLTVDFKVDEAFRSYFKRETGHKRIHRKELARFVRNLLINGLLCENGYSLTHD